MSKERVSKGNKFALLGSKGPHQARRTSLVLSSKKTSLRTQAFLVAMRPGVNTRSHPETRWLRPGDGRWYCTGDGCGRVGGRQI